MKRRQALAAVATGLGAGLAGCGFGGGDGTEGGTTEGSDAGPSAVTVTGTSVGTGAGTADGSDAEAPGGTAAWPLPLFDARNSSAALDRTGPDGGLARRDHWAYEPPADGSTVGMIYGSPAAGAERIVLHVTGEYMVDGEPQNVRELVALDRDTWTVDWRQETQPMGTVSTVVWDDVVLHPSLDGTVVRAAADGTVRWTQPAVGIPMATPTVAGEVVLQASSEGLFALSLTDGAVRWDAPVRGVWHPPAVADWTVYATTANELVALDAESGTVQWREGHDAFVSHRVRGENPGPLGPPVVTDDSVVAAASSVVLASRGAGGLVAFDRDDGSVAWAFDVEAHFGTYEPPPRGAAPATSLGILGQPAHADGTLYVTGSDQNQAYIHAIDAATGDSRWQRPTSGLGYHVPVTADRVVVVSRAAVEVFDRTGGDRLGGVSLGDAGPRLVPHQTLAGDTVITASPRGLSGFRE